MMPMITDKDRKMMEKTKKWLYVGDDGKYHLKEDAPPEIRKFYKKIRELYNLF